MLLMFHLKHMDEMELDRSNDFRSEDYGCEESDSKDAGTKLKERLKKIILKKN
jgi:hypothetical protein